MARKRLSAIKAVRDPARRVTEARDLLTGLDEDREGLVHERDLAAMAAIVHEGHRTSEVVERMGVWRTAWVKARARVRAAHPNPSPDYWVPPEVAADYGYPPPMDDAWGVLKRTRGQIDRLDAYADDVRRVRDEGCQALADAGYRNFQIRDLAGVSSSYISQMGLDRGVESITSAQQARKALRQAGADPERAAKIRARAAEKGWGLTSE